MKKYELIKPLLGIDFLKIGDIFSPSGEYYDPVNPIGSNISYLKTILHKDVVENNPEYFKLVEEESVNFEIIEFYDPNNKITYLTEDFKNFTPNIDIDFDCGIDYCIKKYNIKTVIRLSDGVEFSVGSFVKNANKRNGAIHKIESLKISRKQKNRTEFFGPDCIYITYENGEGGNWLDNSELMNVVLETEDKYKLCLGDYVYRVVLNGLGYNNILFTEHINENFKIQPNSTYFGDEFNAKMYINLNSVIYSYKDILNACSNDDITVQQREEFGLDIYKTIIDLRKLIKKNDR